MEIKIQGVDKGLFSTLNSQAFAQPSASLASLPEMKKGSEICKGLTLKSTAILCSRRCEGCIPSSFLSTIVDDGEASKKIPHKRDSHSSKQTWMNDDVVAKNTLFSLLSTFTAPQKKTLLHSLDLLFCKKKEILD